MRSTIAAASWRHPLGLLGVAILVAACGSTAPSTSPFAIASPATSPATSPAASAPVPTATAGTPVPSAAATPTVAPSPAPSMADACPIAPQTGRLPSDRMIGVKLSGTPMSDLVTFEFGNTSVPEPPQGTSQGTLEAAEPPYTQAASGLEMDIAGDHVVQVRFSGMSLMNDVGELTYDGPLDLRLDGAVALRDVRNFDMFEGVVGWYIGYDGNGCVRLSSDATSVTIAIDHPRS